MKTNNYWLYMNNENEQQLLVHMNNENEHLLVARETQTMIINAFSAARFSRIDIWD